MKILVTGFDPFGGEKVNPAYEAVKLLPDNIAGAEIIKLEVPTVFAKSSAVMEEKIKEVNPDIVLCVGQAGGRSHMTVEKVAVNLIDARIPDNEGNQEFDLTIKEDGETAYFATIPVKAMIEKMNENKVPTLISYSAGTFVCNDIMYNLLYLIDKKYPNIKGGFIHVPFDTAQTVGKPLGTASMPISKISEGLEYAIEAIVENDEDISAAGGTTH